MVAWWGGSLVLLAVLLNEGEALRYLGCHKDSLSVRLLPEEKRDFKGQLTLELCRAYCTKLVYRYFGLQWRHECFCSHDRPSYKSLADESTCNLPCDGDGTEVCGGTLRISVYDREDDKESPVAKHHLGCFIDTTDRMLKGPKWDSDLQTPDLCVGYCYRRGYRFAGVENGNECLCGDSIRRTSKVQISDCSMDCEGDQRYKCGGNWRINTYHTGIPDLASDGREVGCYNDNSQNLRLLSAMKFELKQTNTPRRCMNLCLAAGFKFSGTEYGYECYCGNRTPTPEKEAQESDCLRKCPGDKEEYCGGTWKILVYSTGYGKMKPVIPEMVSLTGGTYRPSQPTRRPSTGTVSQRPPTRTTVKPTPTKVSFTNTNTETVPGSSHVTPKPAKKCETSVTTANGRPTCKGQLIFREEFAGNEIDNKKWSSDIFMPMNPDYEFVVFSDVPKNSYVSNNKLYITPTVMDDETVRKGKIELQNCTGQEYSEECVRQAATFSILPPIQSARINTMQFFSFQYGVIQVRAKLPVGDWIIPELWLRPKRSTYGIGYASGRVRLAMARGNMDLKSGEYSIGNNHLESGILMGVGENVRGRTVFTERRDGWHKDFHNFTLVWTPDNLLFLVDSEHETELMPPEGGNMCELVGFNNDECSTWRKGTSISPFDREFYISLGLSVGGMRDFPDESVSGQATKPWKNRSVKALANFWQARHNWRATWDDENSSLQVDSIRVYAL